MALGGYRTKIYIGTRTRVFKTCDKLSAAIQTVSFDYRLYSIEVPYQV